MLIALAPRHKLAAAGWLAGFLAVGAGVLLVNAAFLGFVWFMQAFAWR